MIYTLTLNPALDYTVKIDKLERGKIILSDSQHMAIGGKGINVSLVLKELEIPLSQWDLWQGLWVMA